MRPQQFDRLRERLLRGGISPRHAKRYLAELGDHFEDVARTEMQNGASREAAEEIAQARIGDDDQLIDGILARPELRAFSVRYPWAFYGLGSVLAFVGALILVAVLTGLFLAGAAAIAVRAQTYPDFSMWAVAAGFRIFATHGLPIILGGAIIVSAVRQRMPVRWPVIGIAMISILGALTNFEVGAGPPGHRHLMISAGLSLDALTQTMIHVTANLAVLLTLYVAAAKRLGVKSPG